MSGDIIAVIDRAIEDHSVSSDAMRWTPEPPANPDGDVVSKWLMCADGDAGRVTYPLTTQVTYELVDGTGFASSSDSVADMHRIMQFVRSAQFLRASRIEVHHLTLDFVRVAFARAEPPPPWRPNPVTYGLPIVVNNGLRPGQWRAIDADGGVMREASVFWASDGTVSGDAGGAVGGWSSGTVSGSR